MVRQSGDIPGWGSSLMGHRVVMVPGSGAWVQCGHGPINGAAQATLGVVDIGTGAGATSETAGVCGFGVAVVAGATGGSHGSCAGLAGAGNGTEM